MRKLCLFAAGYLAALLLSFYVLPESAIIWVAAGLAAACLGLASLRRTRKPAVLLPLGAAVIGLIWSFGYTQRFIAPARGLVGSEAEVSLRITEFAQQGDGYIRLTARITAPGYIRSPIYIYDYGSSSGGLMPGDEVKGRLRFLTADEQFGEKSDAYISRGIYVRASARGELEKTGKWSASFLYAPKRLAHGIAGAVAELFNENTAGFMTALLTGDKTSLYSDEESYLALKTAGLSHVVAVSGMHLGFLIGFVRLLTGRRRKTAAICVPVIVAFMAMTGFTPSVVRAGVMQLLMLLAPLLRRENDPLTTLSFAFLVLTGINPNTVGSVSLQLSFAAMLGITVFSQKIYDWLEKRREALVLSVGKRELSFPRGLSGVIAGSIGASIFTVPLTALHFGFVSSYALLTNLLCTWAVSAAFLGGYLCCAVYAVIPAAGRLLARLVGIFPAYILFAAEKVSDIPYAALYTRSNYVAWLIVFVYAVFILAWLFRGEGKMRPVLPVCACIVAFCTVSLVISDSPEGSLTVSAISVGQGQSIAATTQDAAVLIDCGGLNYPENAGQCAAEYLFSEGKSRVDLLVLTHLHADHANGVRSLLGLIDVGCIMMPTDADDAGYTDVVLEAAEKAGTEVYFVEEDTDVTLGSLDIRVYAPLGTEDANERGLIILGDYGDFEFLVTGDADKSTEMLFTKLNDLPDIELLIVGHHGSKHSTSWELLDETTPDVAFISVGENSYGHPTEETLERLEERGIEIHRTDEEGTVSLTVGG